MAGNNIKEWIDNYYRQNPVPATISITIPLAPTTGIKDVLPHMSQNLLGVVGDLHAAISADPDNTDNNNNEAVIQALQQALDQKMKKHIWIDRVEMPARKGKAPESILKHPDHTGAVRKTHNSAASPTTPLRTNVTAPAITSLTVKNTTASNTSGPQYCYSTPVEDPAIAHKVVNRTLNVPVSITQCELLSISAEACKQYKELTTTRQVSTGTTEVGKLEEVPNDSPAVYSGSTMHDPDGSDDLRVGRDSIPLL
jgi:hypothetical protein